ncbi:hypothetical protein GW17_00002216 [Ensete ventricosum]|nr:hypothetical protein GW17_00002216 [Ensete ventricosum]
MGMRARRCLVFPSRDEAAASSYSSGTRRRLVFPRGDETAPRSPVGRRGVQLGDKAVSPFSREARLCLNFFF